MSRPVAAPAQAPTRAALRTGRRRDHVSTVVVSAMTTLFGVALIEAIVVMQGVVNATGAASASDNIDIGLSVVALVFLFVAVYVGCVVTVNAFGTVIAGRRRSLALLRLIGAEGARLRRAVAAEGLGAGALGALVGLAVGVFAAGVTVQAGLASGWLPATGYELLSPLLLLPPLVVVITTWWAAWVGCRAVVTVSPLEATSVAAGDGAGQGRSGGSTTPMVVLVVVGAAFLALGVLAGLLTPAGLLVSFIGGVLSFTGIVVGGRRLMPPLLSLVGRAWRGGGAGGIAVAGARRYPERSARTAVALLIGVALVTTCAVALGGFGAAATARMARSSEFAAQVHQSVVVATWILTGLIGFSALIAGVGLVNTMLMGVVQRTRELGLLRALGFSRAQLRGMISVEALHLTVTAIVFGVLLGCLYGWVAAQSLMGRAVDGFVPLVVPWSVVSVVVVGALLLALLAAVVAARRAVTVSPVDAIATE